MYPENYLVIEKDVGNNIRGNTTNQQIWCLHLIDLHHLFTDGGVEDHYISVILHINKKFYGSASLNKLPSTKRRTSIFLLTISYVIISVTSSQTINVTHRECICNTMECPTLFSVFCVAQTVTGLSPLWYHGNKPMGLHPWRDCAQVFFACLNHKM